jgi:hypothetical protein
MTTRNESKQSCALGTGAGLQETEVIVLEAARRQGRELKARHIVQHKRHAEKRFRRI